MTMRVCAFFTFILIILFSRCEKDSNIVEIDASVCNQIMDTNGYNLHFPLPFTEYEMKYTSYEEKLEKRQLPKDILTTLTLDELFNHCMWWELVPDVLLFNSYQQGFRSYYQNFNGIRELYKRDGIHYFLEKKLRGIDTKDMISGRCGLYNHLLEFMYVQQECLGQYLESEIKNTLAFLFEKVERLSYLTTLGTKDYSTLSMSQWMLGIGNILKMYEYQPFLDELVEDLELQAFFEAKMNANKNIIEKVSYFGTQFYNEIK